MASCPPFRRTIAEPSPTPALPTWTRMRSIHIALLHYPLDCPDEPFRPAPELVVKPEPPEQDLDFTIAFHTAENSTNRERVGKPLGIGCAGVEHPRSLPEYIYCPGLLRLWIPSFARRPEAAHAEGRGRLHYEAPQEGIRLAVANGDRGADAVQPRWRPYAGADRGPEGAAFEYEVLD